VRAIPIDLLEKRVHRISEVIDARYEALMFAKSPAAARRAALDLIDVVLGDEAADYSLERGLRECCKVMRPAEDPKEQIRYENEFIELGIWPQSSAKQVSAAQAPASKVGEQELKQQAA
jgi:hypothetical protein